MNKNTLLAVSILLSFTAFSDRVALTLENDCLLQTRRDEDYTHGTGFEYVHDIWHVKIQQNMYTPDDITRYDHIVGDRPFCGWLGAEIGQEVFKEENSPWSHYFAVNFGMIGPSSQAGNVQKWIHKVFDCRTPNGWHNQLHDEFCVNFQWWTRYNWYICDYVAVIPRVGVMAGTVQDVAEIGFDLKIGYNIKKSNDIGNNIMFSAVRKSNSFLDNFSIYIYGGPDGRCYVYNHMLQGSLFNDKDDELAVDMLPVVGELQFGAGMEIYGFFIKWYGVVRTSEYRHQGKAPDYGGLVFGYSF